MNSHRNVLAWQACLDLVLAVYRVTKHFPQDERFALTSQLRRAAVSAAANIAEGQAGAGDKEKAQGANLAIGSLAEVDTLLAVADSQGYLVGEEPNELESKRIRASQLTVRLHQSLARRIKPSARTRKPST